MVAAVRHTVKRCALCVDSGLVDSSLSAAVHVVPILPQSLPLHEGALRPAGSARFGCPK